MYILFHYHFVIFLLPFYYISISTYSLHIGLFLYCSPILRGSHMIMLFKRTKKVFRIFISNLFSDFSHPLIF